MVVGSGILIGGRAVCGRGRADGAGGRPSRGAGGEERSADWRSPATGAALAGEPSAGSGEVSARTPAKRPENDFAGNGTSAAGKLALASGGVQLHVGAFLRIEIALAPTGAEPEDRRPSLGEGGGLVVCAG